MAHRRSGLCRPERKDSGMVWLPSILESEIKLVFPPVPVADTMLVPWCLFLYHGTSSSKQLTFFFFFGPWDLTCEALCSCCSDGQYCNPLNSLPQIQDHLPCHKCFLPEVSGRLLSHLALERGRNPDGLGVGDHSLLIASQPICSLLKYCLCWEDNGSSHSGRDLGDTG